MRLSYPCEVSRDPESGQVILECKNPSAFAFGDSLEAAEMDMHSLLLDCVADYVDEGKIFPTTVKRPKKNEVSVELTASETVKVLFRILNPRQKTKIDTLERAIEATGKKLIYSVV